MSTPPDPVGLLRPFLTAVEGNANRLVEGFDACFTSPVPGGHHTQPVRLRGQIGQLREAERVLARATTAQHGTITHEFITRRMYKSTAYDAEVRKLYEQEEVDRSRAQEEWYAGLTGDDKVVLDTCCLAIADSIIRPHFPKHLPACVHGPLARLALQYSAIVRRAVTQRADRERSLADRGLSNRGVVDSVVRVFTNVAEEARERLVGRWLRELTPEQAAGLDGGSRSIPADPLAGLRELVVQLRLKGNDAIIINALCESKGEMPLKDLAVHCKWQPPFTEWNSARCRLNKKLKKYRWELGTHDRNARVRPITKRARK